MRVPECADRAVACQRERRAGAARRRGLLELVEQGLGLEQVDAAVDEVDDRLQLGLLLDLLLDEPLEELEAAVVAGRGRDGGHPVELRGDVRLRLERALGRVRPTRTGSTRP